MRAAVDRGSRLLGIVENMTGQGFEGSAGDDLAREFTVPVLARIPWHPAPDSWEALVGRLG
jgi:Mrp family chromosome partitioning ATPase